MLLSGQLGVALYLSTVDYTILLCEHWNGETRLSKVKPVGGDAMCKSTMSIN